MACNENVIKNIANEVTRNCQNHNVNVDADFVIYLIELLLLNPKYGKLLSKSINRTNLEYFVNECVSILIGGEISISTLKMQFTFQTNYDKLQNLIDKHIDSIECCLKPLVNEILEADPELDDESGCKKLFRKISIYIILASGLGNPGVIITLKEGMAALESIFTLDDLKIFVALPRAEKLSQLNELMQVTSGVRLFNRDCKKGGEGIPDLPFNLIDAGKACLTYLSNSLITVMQRVNLLTTAIEDCVSIQDETGNVYIDIPPNYDLTENHYKHIFDLLAFHRQYELIVRRLVADMELLATTGAAHADSCRSSLEELHDTTKFKAAVPAARVIPLFSKLWNIWRGMQNIMYLISTVNRLMSLLAAIHNEMKIPHSVLDKMLKGKEVLTDQDRMNFRVSVEERLSLGSLKNYVSHNDSLSSFKDKHIQFLGFCALCLCSGALVPSNMKIGFIKCKNYKYGFCNVKMAARFAKDAQRYVNEVYEYARNHPHLINLMNLIDQIYEVKNIDSLVTKHYPKIQKFDKNIQTETHPIQEHIEKNYTSNLWEWKRRACQWASIVNCKTHSTQTNYSHLRSEIHCQTYSPRDKSLQTNRECGVNTSTEINFIWGLRGQIGYGQHTMDLKETQNAEKLKLKTYITCEWPCYELEKKEIDSPEDDQSQKILVDI